jgi:hypothetical protein
MATNNTTNVSIVPGRMASYATALRACINEVCAYARTGESLDMEDAIAHMRRNVTRLETEARLNVEA